MGRTEQKLLTFTRAVFKSSTRVCFGWEADAAAGAASSRSTAANCKHAHVSIRLIRARGRREGLPGERGLFCTRESDVRMWKAWHW